MESYDMMYGRPLLALQRRMREVTQRILDMPDWAAFFRMIGFPMPPNEVGQRMTSLMRRAWTRSIQKGYHKKVLPTSTHQMGTSYRYLVLLHGSIGMPSENRTSYLYEQSQLVLQC